MISNVWVVVLTAVFLFLVLALISQAILIRRQNDQTFHVFEDFRGALTKIEGMTIIGVYRNRADYVLQLHGPSFGGDAVFKPWDKRVLISDEGTGFKAEQIFTDPADPVEVARFFSSIHRTMMTTSRPEEHRVGLSALYHTVQAQPVKSPQAKKAAPSPAPDHRSQTPTQPTTPVS